MVCMKKHTRHEVKRPPTTSVHLWSCSIYYTLLFFIIKNQREYLPHYRIDILLLNYTVTRYSFQWCQFFIDYNMVSLLLKEKAAIEVERGQGYYCPFPHLVKVHNPLSLSTVCLIEDNPVKIQIKVNNILFPSNLTSGNIILMEEREEWVEHGCSRSHIKSYQVIRVVFINPWNRLRTLNRRSCLPTLI